MLPGSSPVSTCKVAALGIATSSRDFCFPLQLKFGPAYLAPDLVACIHNWNIIAITVQIIKLLLLS